MYIREYQKILYNQNVRVNSQLTQHVIDLIMERLKLEGMCPPELKAILRRQPMPQAPIQPQVNPSVAASPEEKSVGKTKEAQPIPTAA